MVGSRDVLIVAPLAALLGVAAGTLLGLIMGYYRGTVDDVLSRIVEAFLALPVILVALLTLVVLGHVAARRRRASSGSCSRRSSRGPSARRSCPSASSTTSRPPSSAASRACSSCRARSSRTSSGPTVVEMTVRFGYAIFTVATLSFLGVGTPAAVAGLGPDRQRGVHEHDLAASGGRRCSRPWPSRARSSPSTSSPTRSSRC